MIDIEAKMDLRVLDAGIFKRVGKIANDLRPAWRQARKPVLADLRDHRKKKQAPRGNWPELAASTKARYRADRKAGRRVPRRLLGKLPSANRARYERKRMVVESLVSWSGRHKKGGRAGKAILPARNAWWISRALRHEVRDILVRVIVQRAKNKGVL